MKTGIYWQDPKYALRPGRDFIFDPSLVLYLPLGKLDGASFMSKEARGYLCTVTGALWRPDGMSFDGNDDVIDCGISSAFDIVNAITLEAWVWIDGDWMDGASAIDKGWAYMIGKEAPTDAFMFGLALDVAGWKSISDSGFATSAWHHLVGTYLGTEGLLRMYVDGVLEATSAQFIDTINYGVASVSVGGDASTAFYHGYIGEARIYNRALSALEIQRNHLATKRRYQ